MIGPPTPDAVFAEAAERYRGELWARCYRILGSAEDADDAVQEALLRAWRWRAKFRGDAALRSWLYRIATNASLDVLRRRPPTASWQDQDGEHDPLDAIPASDPEPAAALVAKETVELTLEAAVRHLPTTQRTILLMRYLLGWSARDAAGSLDATVASVNSSLQRARTRLRDRLPEERLEWAPDPQATDVDRAQVRRYMSAIPEAA